MSRAIFLRLFVIPFLAVFMASIIFTVPARADDATPPPVDPPAATSNAADTTSAPTDPPSSDTVAAPAAATAAADTGGTAVDTTTSDAGAGTPVPPTAAAPVLPSPAAPSNTTNGSPAPILSKVPAGTNVVVVDGAGKKVPLASQEAANIIATGDPIWCPSTVAHPVAGASGCSPFIYNGNLYTLFNAVQTNLWKPKVTNSTIWITGGADSSASPISLDGGTLPSLISTLKNFTLTLKGGWTGTLGTINTSAPSIFNQPISITGWNSNITLSDIQIIGASGDGLTIKTKKNISLTRVQSNSNTGNGVILDNCIGNGTKCTGTGSVTINSSQFNLNGIDGLDINSRGGITLNSISASANGTIGPGGLGANLDNCQQFTAFCSGAGGVKVLFSSFNTNQADGLDVTSGGTITVNSLTANGSVANTGASLINSPASSAQPVTLTGNNVFNGNSAYGLSIESLGLITVNNLTANGNDTSLAAPGPMGVSLINDLFGSRSGITIGGTNNFDGNYYNGLYVFSNGPIKMNNINSSSNTAGAGAFITNNGLTAPQPVTLTGTNQFNGDGLGGLIIYSNGAISINNVTADGNGAFDPVHPGNGAYLDNCNLVSSACTNIFARPVNVLGSNEFNSNYQDGLNIQSLGGAITVNNIVASFNGLTALDGVGARLENNNSFFQAGVKVSGNNVFNGNYNEGLLVVSFGAITANHITADSTVNTSSNFGYGAFLDNCDFVTSSCTAPGIQSVTLTSSNEFNNNSNHGLVIESRGTITLNNISANTNGLTSTSHGAGALLQNNFSNSAGGVTLIGAYQFNNNYGTTFPVGGSTVNIGGLAVLSKGNITANNLTANLNTHGDGVYLNNSYAGISRSVTLTGSNTFNTNGYDGLDVESFGNIYASDLNANGNGAFGVSGDGAYLFNKYINTSSILSNGTVKVTGTNIFAGNFENGLEAFSNGAISLANLIADSSVNNDGAYLDNTTAPSAQPVTINGNNAFNFNNGNGLTIFSNGAITVKSISAVSNATGYGALLENDFGGFAANVTLSGSDLFNGNNLDGLNVTSLGAITLNTASLTATGNTGNGVYLINYYASTPKPITLKGTSVFDNNGYSGIVMYSSGAITAGNLTSTNNQGTLTSTTGWGAVLYNGTVGVGNVTLTGNNFFYGNSHDGLTVTSRGAITVSNIVSNSNGQLHASGLYGIWLNNSGALSNQGVTINGTNVFDANWSGGMYVNTKGAIKINNVNASGNTGIGGTLINNAGPFTSGVTLTGASFFEGNTGDGLNIMTNGKVTLTDIYAVGNSGDGLDATTPLTLSLTCGIFTNNTQYGININTGGKATFIGAALSGNTSGDTINQMGGGSVVLGGPCTLP